MGPEQALAELRAGNDRFATDQSLHPRIDAARVRDTYRLGQAPIAAVLGCSDSRVPVELVFDQGCGDLFVIRVAGNVCRTSQLASLEFAVTQLRTPLVLVLGHTNCGAVSAAVAGTAAAGALADLLGDIAPAVERARARTADTDEGALVDAAVRENVWSTIEHALGHSPVIAAAVGGGTVAVVGAVYHLATGRVEWLGPHPRQAEVLAGGGPPAA